MTIISRDLQPFHDAIKLNYPLFHMFKSVIETLHRLKYFPTFLPYKKIFPDFPNTLILTMYKFSSSKSFSTVTRILYSGFSNPPFPSIHWNQKRRKKQIVGTRFGVHISRGGWFLELPVPVSQIHKNFQPKRWLTSPLNSFINRHTHKAYDDKMEPLRR